MSSQDDVFEIIREEWRDAAPRLAEWVLEHLVNRRDVWGQYTTPTEKEKLNTGKTYKALTLPQKAMRGKDMVTLDKLMRHFRAASTGHLIGLHAAHPDNTAKWLALDIDLHDPGAVEAEDAARRNFAAASSWWDELQRMGHDPLLIDSNGAGGFHVLVVFGEPAPLAGVHALGQRLASTWKEKNIDGPPELFPRGPRLEGEKLGAWLRLFGRHHTRRHFSKVWSGDPWLDEPWLEGSAAVEAILGLRPGPPPPASQAANERERPRPDPLESPRTKPGRFPSRGAKKPDVCVDLDGVLARYDGWAGKSHIGDPLPGALEFATELRKFVSLIIHTSRASDPEGLKSVRTWLEKHGIPYDAIHSGPGKPRAHAYVDDRSIPCSPQKLGPAAYLAAERQVRRWCHEQEPDDGNTDTGLAELIAAWPQLTEPERNAIAKILDERGQPDP